MITTRSAPGTRRFLIGAFALSVLVHVFGGGLWAGATHAIAHVMRRLPEQHQREQYVATSDVIHLEKRTVPRSARRSLSQNRAQPMPREREPRTAPAAEVASGAIAENAKTASKRDTPSPAAKPDLAHAKLQAPRKAEKSDLAKAANADARATADNARVPTMATASRQSALSSRELAQLNAQFAKTIASTHVDLASIQKRSEQQPVAVSRRPLSFAGIQAKLQRGQGYISPTTVGRRIGGTMWYYAHYTYMWPDGRIEEDDIPWPFRFPVGNDPFAAHADVLIPVQLPPPGFHVTRPLKPFLAHFLRDARSQD